MIKRNKILLMISLIVIILLAMYYGFALYFTQHFYFGTTINGVNVGGKSINLAKSTMQTLIDGYELTFIERDGTVETIKGNDFDLAIQWDKDLEELLKAQDGYAWIENWINPSEHNTIIRLTYNEEKLQTLVDGLSCMKADKQIEPEDAKISEYTEGEGYKIIPAMMGSKINQTAFYAKVKEYIYCMKTKLNLDDTYCYELPYVLDDDVRLNVAVEQLNNMICSEITLEVGSQTEVLDASVFQPWISVNDNLQVVINEDAVTEYVDELASAYNTYHSTKRLMTSYGVEVAITNSHYGWIVDEQAEKEAIIKNILSGEQIVRELNYSVTANSRDGNDFGNSYVEINLGTQHLFLYVNGQLILESDFVSGNVSKSYYTPNGAYRITYKEKNATLNGADYSTPVDYWMPFAGNVGMHDATWRADFGGDIYLTNGSHGCVNLPWSSAKKIFEYVDAGFPVLVYTLYGT